MSHLTEHLSDFYEEFALLDICSTLIESRQKPACRSSIKIWRVLEKEGQKTDFDKTELLTYINVVISLGDKLIEHHEDVVSVIKPSWIESRSN